MQHPIEISKEGQIQEEEFNANIEKINKMLNKAAEFHMQAEVVYSFGLVARDTGSIPEAIKHALEIWDLY